VHVSFQVRIFSRYMPRSGIAGSYGNSMCSFFKTERLHFRFSLSCIGEGNGNPLQCSCLENPRDGKPGELLSMGRTESDTTEAT